MNSSPLNAPKAVDPLSWAYQAIEFYALADKLCLPRLQDQIMNEIRRLGKLSKEYLSLNKIVVICKTMSSECPYGSMPVHH